ncbi:uncharacterized protein [Anabrus simplex]|uniref:uncharacterized protein n=1 Tax=Anabrus simplex TaxID=316456 RepID=UPI0035A3A9E8
MLEQEANGAPDTSNQENAQNELAKDVHEDAGVNEEEKGENGEGTTSEDKGKDEEYYAVFLRNIPFTATEDDVKEHFEKVCKVKKVSFVVDNGKFRGRATVELVDRESYEEAQKLIGSLMGGRPLYVVPHRAMKPEEETGSDGKKIYKVIVSNLPTSVSVLEAKRHFYSAGLIRRFLVKNPGKKKDSSKHDGTAILKVDKLEAYNNVLKMDGSMLGGQPIKVEPWKERVIDETGSFKRVADSEELERDSPKRRKRPKSTEQQRADLETSLTVFVGNLPYIVSKEDIIKHFEQAGEVRDCKIPVIATAKIRRPVAFIRMADQEGHEKALKLLGSSIGDCQIHVDMIRDYNRMSKWVFCDKPPKKEKEEFVAFVGNIPYTTTKESLEKHFEGSGNIQDINIPVKNGLQRGMAYIKLGDQVSFEKALELHHTTLDGRVIDVLDASRGDNLYDVPLQPRRNKHGGKRWGRYGRGVHELTWHTLCRP